MVHRAPSWFALACCVGMIAYGASSCGVEQGGSVTPSESSQEITGDIRGGEDTGGSSFAVSFLLENESLATACRGVFNQDQTRTTDDSLLFKYDFKTGDQVILEDATLGFGIVKAHYSNASETGTATFSLDESLVTLSCDGYVSTVVVLAGITLYSDSTYTTEVCTLATGTVVKNAGVFGRIVDTNNTTGTYLATVEFDTVVGSCPAETELHYQKPQEFVDLGADFARYDLLSPILQVFMPPDG